MPYKDPVKRAAYRKAWTAANPEKEKAYQHISYNRHHAKRLAKSQKYREAHREETREQARQYARDHFEERRIYRQANPVAYYRNIQKYLRNHPEKRQQNNAKRRARKANAPRRDLTAAQWKAIKEAFAHCCAYCGRKMQHLSQDHITPLVYGGEHTLWNVVPACRSCNSKKGTKNVLVPVQPLLLVA